MKKMMCSRWFLEITWEQLHDCTLLSPTCRNCPLRHFLRRKLLLDMSSEVHVDWVPCVGYCFLRNYYLMTCVLPLCLHKVKKTFGGSRWKLRMLTHVSRFLAYVTTWNLQRPTSLCAIQRKYKSHNILVSEKQYSNDVFFLEKNPYSF